MILEFILVKFVRYIMLLVVKHPLFPYSCCGKRVYPRKFS